MKKLLLLLLCLPLFARGQVISTFAGNGVAGYSGDGGPATSAALNNPSDVFRDGSGNVYIADNWNNRVRKVNTAGIISTIAGNGVCGYSGDGGPATAASLNAPNRVFVDGNGNVYIADMGNHVVRMINTSGIISTIAGNGTAGFSGDGGLAIHAQLSDPTGVAADANGNIFISDSGNNHIRKVTPAGIISTYAGGGSVDFTADGVQATSVRLCEQMYVSVDNSGTIYLPNRDCWHFLKVTPDGLIYNVAGSAAASYAGDCGPADSALIEFPYGICPDNRGNVYLCERQNIRVRRVNTFNIISTVAGTGLPGYTGDGGPAALATLSPKINGIYADASGDVYLADMANNVIRCFAGPPDVQSTDTLCAGAVATLSDSVGVWSSSNTAVASADAQTGAVTALSGGTATIICSSAACPVFQVVVDTFPVLNFGQDTLVCQGNPLVLSSGNIAASWSTGAADTSIIVTAPGTYWSTVSNRCRTVTDTINVNFDFCDFYFPSAFTPNNDGRNDIARPGGSLAYYADYSLSIYNRWGQRVFYTTDIYDGWNGRYLGQPQVTGTYFYMISYTFDEKQTMLKGDLTLIR